MTGKEEGKDIAHRTCDHRDDKGVFHRRQEYFVLQDQVDVVLEADKPRGLQDVVIGKAQNDGRCDRQDKEGEKQDRIRREEQVTSLIPLRQRPAMSHLFPLHGQES